MGMKHASASTDFDDRFMMIVPVRRQKQALLPALVADA
jgi:hypothetical protein